MQLGKDLYKALILRYEHAIADAKARLKIYFENPVGIGEHPQHTEEMGKLLSQLSMGALCYHHGGVVEHAVLPVYCP